MNILRQNDHADCFPKSKQIPAEAVKSVQAEIYRQSTPFHAKIPPPMIPDIPLLLPFFVKPPTKKGAPVARWGRCF